MPAAEAQVDTSRVPATWPNSATTSTTCAMVSPQAVDIEAVMAARQRYVAWNAPQTGPRLSSTGAFAS